MSKPDFTLIDGSDRISQQASAWFARLRADDVSENERRQWQRWLAQDRAHRHAYERIEALWSSLGDFARAPEIEQHLRQAPGPAHAVRVPARRPLRWLGAMAATLVAAAIGAFFVLEPQPAADIEYHTGVGERRSLQLEDGTRVDLDAGSQLRMRYDAQARRITLQQGRAFFQVSHDAKRPFTVMTEAGGVRVLGTQFEVSRLADAIDVSLFEGSVELLAAGADAQRTARVGLLVPGQKARMASNRMRLLPQTVALGGSPAWMTGRLVFNDTPLAEALAEFNRYSRQPLVLADPALGTHRVSGVFRGEDAEGFVEALREVYGIQEHHTAEGAHVLGRKP